MKVIKRNGIKVEFNSNKIYNAIKKAKEQIGCTILDLEITSICDSISKLNKELTVEEIQDIVVKKLMVSKHKDLAMAYQSYRTLREDARIKEQTIYKQIGQLLDVSEEILNENANKDGRNNSVQRDLLAGITSKEYYLNKILPKHISKAHIEGRIHVHDLDCAQRFQETISCR